MNHPSTHDALDDAWNLFADLRIDSGEGSVSRWGGGGGGVDAGTNESADDSPSAPWAPSEESSFCEHCRGNRLRLEEGQYVCADCNVVQSRFIDVGAEWRFFYGNDDNRGSDPTRCGMVTNPLLPKSSLGSVIAGRRNDSLEMRRIRRYQMWNSMPYWERQLLKMFDRMNNSTHNEGIPSKVMDDAFVMYAEVSKRKISRGDTKEGIIASCIFHSCILNHIPRSAREIARMFHIDPIILTKGNARFQSLLRMNVESSNPADFISRFGSRLNMPFDHLNTAKELAKRIDSWEIISENAPTSVAAGVLFYYILHNKLPYTKKQLSDVCDVSEVTITKCYKRLVKYKAWIDNGRPDDKES
jgi:transcription initiation factor TFIIB